MNKFHSSVLLFLLISFTTKVNSQSLNLETTKIGNLEVSHFQLTDIFTWEQAKIKCEELGNNWRLPTKDEMAIVSKYKEIIGISAMFSSYWTSTDVNKNLAWSVNIFQNTQQMEDKTWNRIICPVRYCEYSTPPLLTKTYIIGSLEISRNDIGKNVNWYDALSSCKNLGNGWRLPTILELDILFKNKDKIGGFQFDNYWSSSVNEVFDFAWHKNFWSGTQENGGKNNLMLARPVRTL